METVRDVRLASLKAELSSLEQREKALVYLARKACTGNRAEAELELLRVQEAIASAHAQIDAMQ